jgi:hypothetical protein
MLVVVQHELRVGSQQDSVQLEGESLGILAGGKLVLFQRGGREGLQQRGEVGLDGGEAVPDRAGRVPISSDVAAKKHPPGMFRQRTRRRVRRPRIVRAPHRGEMADMEDGIIIRDATPRQVGALPKVQVAAASSFVSWTWGPVADGPVPEVAGSKRAQQRRHLLVAVHEGVLVGFV